jgi:hypothetical protein
VSIPQTEPFDLVRKPKPPLDGFYWEDIVFIPAQPARPTPPKRTGPRLSSTGLRLALTALMIGAIRIAITSAPEPNEQRLTLAHVVDGPETTGSIRPRLRPTLAD